MFLIDRLLKLLTSNIGDASTPERRASLAHEIRSACINVGFFYSEYIHTIYFLIFQFINVGSHWARDTPGDHRQPGCSHGVLLFASTRDQDEGNMGTRPIR